MSTLVITAALALSLQAASATEPPGTDAAPLDPGVASSTIIVDNAYVAAAYPRESMRRGEEGDVQLRVTIDDTGDLMGCAVVRSSGYAALDRASCDVMIFNGRFEPVVDDRGQRVRGMRDGMIAWRLPDGSRRPDTPPPPSNARQLAVAGAPVICRYSLTTGSTRRRTKQCHSEADWSRADAYAREETDRMQNPSGQLPYP